MFLRDLKQPALILGMGAVADSVIAAAVCRANSACELCFTQGDDQEDDIARLAPEREVILLGLIRSVFYGDSELAELAELLSANKHKIVGVLDRGTAGLRTAFHRIGIALDQLPATPFPPPATEQLAQFADPILGPPGIIARVAALIGPDLDPVATDLLRDASLAKSGISSRSCRPFLNLVLRGLTTSVEIWAHAIRQLAAHPERPWTEDLERMALVTLASRDLQINTMLDSLFDHGSGIRELGPGLSIDELDRLPFAEFVEQMRARKIRVLVSEHRDTAAFFDLDQCDIVVIASRTAAVAEHHGFTQLGSAALGIVHRAAKRELIEAIARKIR